LAARGCSEALVSLDLGLSRTRVAISAAGVTLDDGLRLGWEQVEAIAQSETGCFLIGGSDLGADRGAAGRAASDQASVEKIQRFSEELNRAYSLMPTTSAPTMLLSGFPMHRIKGIDPHQDTLRKIAALSPVVGRVLDTTTGLGYTAIETARTADEVVTIELDPLVIEIAGCNPWSQGLFENPKIRQIIGDAAEQITRLPAEYFSRIFHDPPMFRLAGELYSLDFYQGLFRVLRPGGRLFHYIGDLDSPSGSSVVKGVVRRLETAGFSRVARRPEAFGVTAQR
jgi:uncharacterized protein